MDVRGCVIQSDLPSTACETPKAPQTLLIIEDDHQVRRMMMRLMKRHFIAVHTAGSVAVAEAILEKYPVTHIVLDYNLGLDAPNGTDLIPAWRRAYPMISRVVLLTGARISTLDVPKDVDVSINKGEDPIYIVERLIER